MWACCSKRPASSCPASSPATSASMRMACEQKVTGFKRVEAPITALLLCEFAATNYNFIYDMRNAACAFAQQLRPQDYVALMTFDMRTQIVTDFTQDKRQLLQGHQLAAHPRLQRDATSSTRSMRPKTGSAASKAASTSSSSPPAATPSPRSPSTRSCRRSRATPDVTIFTISTGGCAARHDRGPRRHEGVNARHGLPAGRQRDEDLRQADRRHVVLLRALSGEMPDDLLQTSTRTSAPSISWSTTPPTPSRTAPIASCAWNWWTTRASPCACRTRSTSRSSTTSSPATATAPSQEVE